MRLYDVKSKEEWQEILDTTQRDIEMPTALLDDGNAIVLKSGARNNLCTAIREGNESKPFICGTSQQAMASRAQQDR